MRSDSDNPGWAPSSIIRIKGRIPSTLIETVRQESCRFRGTRMQSGSEIPQNLQSRRTALWEPVMWTTFPDHLLVQVLSYLVLHIAAKFWVQETKERNKVTLYLFTSMSVLFANLATSEYSLVIQAEAPRALMPKRCANRRGMVCCPCKHVHTLYWESRW